MPARISFYRPTGQSRRAARSAHDHDVFEGLPVRRWERQWVSVGRPSSTAAPAQPELPLPKDALLLSATSQALLQAARAGSTPNSQADAPKPENTPGAPLFMTKRWVVVPKHMEPPEPVYLAKVPISEEEEQRKKEELSTGGEVTVVTRKRAPPPPKKKRGRKPGMKKVMFTDGQGQAQVEEKKDDIKDVEMVDAATKEDPMPANAVAREIERQEVVMEVQAVAETKSVEPTQAAAPVEQQPLPLPAPTPVTAAHAIPAPVVAAEPPPPPPPAPARAPAPAPATAAQPAPAAESAEPKTEQ